MFNTKRIKALEEELKALCDGLGIDIMYYPASKDYSMRRLYSGGKTFFEVLERRIDAMEKKEIPNIISCSTCKCLIRKEDAIKGESEIVEKNFGRNFSGEETIIEEIQRHYYCHSKDCKPKK